MPRRCLLMALPVILVAVATVPALAPPTTCASSCYGGCPEGAVDVVLYNEGFIVGYSDSRMNPLWVGYRVFAVTGAISHERPSRFSTDSRTSARVCHDDYTNSSFHRGHMAPNGAIDHCYGREAQLETFLMSNVCPQTPSLNLGIWKTLETKVRGWANAFEELWVLTGPVFLSGHDDLMSGVDVPDFFFKIVVDETSSGLRALAFLFTQQGGEGHDLEFFLVSIDDIELMSGFDFFPELEDSLEDRLESQVASGLWDDGDRIPCALSLGYVDARGECIEIRNTTNQPQDLRGWSISDGEGTYRFDGSIVIQAGGSFTVCMDVYNPTHYTSGLYLNNDDDEVYLRNPEGDLCDEKHW